MCADRAGSCVESRDWVCRKIRLAGDDPIPGQTISDNNATNCAAKPPKAFLEESESRLREPPHDAGGVNGARHDVESRIG